MVAPALHREDLGSKRREVLQQLLWLRFVGFSSGLAASLVFPLALMRGAPPGAFSCYMHFSYGAGETVALIATLSAASKRNALPMAVHALVTTAWIVAVSQDCDLWRKLLAPLGAPAGAHHLM